MHMLMGIGSVEPTHWCTIGILMFRVEVYLPTGARLFEARLVPGKIPSLGRAGEPGRVALRHPAAPADKKGATQLPYAALSARFSETGISLAEPVKTAKNSPKYISEGRGVEHGKR